MEVIMPPFEEEGYIALHMSVGMSVGPLLDQSLSEWKLNNAWTYAYGPQTWLGGRAWPVDDPYWYEVIRSMVKVTVTLNV